MHSLTMCLVRPSHPLFPSNFRSQGCRTSLHAHAFAGKKHLEANYKPAKFTVHAISTLLHCGWLMFTIHACLIYMLSNFSQPHLEIAMCLQADEQSESIHAAKKEDIACTCSSLHAQGRLTYADSHRCLLHNDTMEHDCTVKNIVPGLIVPSDEQLDTPCAVEDRCICSSLLVHGNSENECYYHRCPVHDNAMEYGCTYNNIVTGQANFAQFDELPEAISTPEPVEDVCTHVFYTTHSGRLIIHILQKMSST